MLFLSITFYTFIYAQPQTKDISGTVKDKNGVSLEGVLVTLQESTVTSTTNKNGEFSISATVGDKLTFSLPGYETISETLQNNESDMDIILSAFLFGASEQDMVPIAYSNKKKRDLTSSVSITTHDEFEKRQDMNVANGLGGLVNGLIVMSNPWSDLGSNPSFFIRGLRTTNSNNSPLVLVDDVGT